MARRVSLPAADDLFRPTGPGGQEAEVAAAITEKSGAAMRAVPDVADTETIGDTGTTGDSRVPAGAETSAAKASRARSAASGRVRHDEKMTVYVTSEELMAVEHARLTLRGEHGLAVDRGRLVREAVALVLADLGSHGEESLLVTRLRDER